MIEKLKSFWWLLPITIVLIIYIFSEVDTNYTLNSSTLIKENTTPEMRDLNLTR